MRIEIVSAWPMRRWQRRLVDALRGRGDDVRLRPGRRRRETRLISAALALQARLLGPKISHFDRVGGGARERRAVSDSTPTDLIIALDGEQAADDPIESDRARADRVLRPIFDGGDSEAALLAMVARGGPPEIRLRLGRENDAVDIVVAHLAIEDRDVLSRALDQVLARLVTLIVQAVRLIEAEARPVRAPAPQPTGTATAAGATVLSSMARGFARKVAGRLTGAKRGPNHWRVGYRHVGNEDGDGGGARGGAWPKSGARPAAAFTILPDDGAHFYADPVPFVHEGRTYLFLEDFPYATGKAVIAVSEIGADGAASHPRIVLEQPCHLSYPHIIAHAGAIYMLPEMSGAGRVQLFRADPFPDRWVPDRILLDGVVAADATLIQHDGRWWMFATLSDDGGSSWDQLCLFHAPDLLGPWASQAGNPVLVDAGAARPAGAMWHQDGALWRVAQDCRGGYGVGLAICRVDRLDEAGYAQTVVARLGPPDGYGADGTHTLDRAGDLEVIDLRFSSASRSGVPRRRPAAPP